MKIGFKLQVRNAAWRYEQHDIEVPFNVSAGRDGLVIIRSQQRVEYTHRGDGMYLVEVGMVGADGSFHAITVDADQRVPIWMVDGSKFTLTYVEYMATLNPTASAEPSRVRLL